MKNSTGKGKKEPPASKRRVPKPSLLPSKLKTKVTHVDFEGVCGLKPLNQEVQSTFQVNLIDEIANAIVAQGNSETGWIPASNDVNYGLIYLYLLKCYAAYMFNCGLWKEDASDIQSYCAYCIPGFVATMFQNSLHFRDAKKGIDVRLIDPSWDLLLSDAAPTEGSVRNPISVGFSGTEYTFGVGVVLGITDLTQAKAQLIDKKIRSWYSSVVAVVDISKSSSNINQIVGVNNTCMRPVSPFTVSLSLNKAGVVLLPHRANTPTYSSREVISFVNEVPYEKGAPIDYLCTYRKFNPWKFSIHRFPINTPKIYEIAFAWLIRNTNVTRTTAAVTAWNYYINYGAYFLCVMASKAHWSARILDNLGFPFYITTSMKNGNLIPALAANCILPFKRGQSYCIPVFEYQSNDNALQINFQRSAVVTADADAKIGNSVAFGTVNAGYQFAGLAPYPPGTKLNCLPLNDFDELKSFVFQLTNAIEVQATSANISKPACPCACSCALSNNTYSITDVTFTIRWTTPQVVLAFEFVDRFKCECATSCCLLELGNNAPLGWFYRDSFDSSGATVAKAVDAGFRDSNFENFAAARGKGSLSDNMQKFFMSRLLDSVPTQSLTITSKNLVDLANTALNVGIETMEVHHPQLLDDMKGEYDLAMLVDTVASTIANYGVAALGGLAGRIRVRNEL